MEAQGKAVCLCASVDWDGDLADADDGGRSALRGRRVHDPLDDESFACRSVLIRTNDWWRHDPGLLS